MRLACGLKVNADHHANVEEPLLGLVEPLLVASPGGDHVAIQAGSVATEGHGNVVPHGGVALAGAEQRQSLGPIDQPHVDPSGDVHRRSAVEQFAARQLPATGASDCMFPAAEAIAAQRVVEHVVGHLVVQPQDPIDVDRSACVGTLQDDGRRVIGQGHHGRARQGHVFGRRALAGIAGGRPLIAAASGESALEGVQDVVLLGRGVEAAAGSLDQPRQVPLPLDHVRTIGGDNRTAGALARLPDPTGAAVRALHHGCAVELVGPRLQRRDARGCGGLLLGQKAAKSGAHRQTSRAIPLQPAVVEGRDIAQFGQTAAEEGPLWIAGLFLGHDLEPSLLEPGRVGVPQVIQDHRPYRQRVVLAIAVAHARVAADPPQPPVIEGQTLRQLPQLVHVVIEFGRDGQIVGLAEEMEHGHVRQTDLHVAQVHVAVMVQGELFGVVGADVPLAELAPVVDCVAVGVGGDGNAVQQQGRGLLAILGDARRVGIEHGRAVQGGTVPDIALGLVLSGRGVDRAHDLVALQQEIAFAQQHVAQSLPIVVGKPGLQGGHGVRHAFQGQVADPTVAPALAGRAEHVAGLVGVERVAEHLQGSRAQLLARLAGQPFIEFRGGGQDGDGGKGRALGLHGPMLVSTGGVEEQIVAAWHGLRPLPGRGHPFLQQADVVGRGDFRLADARPGKAGQAQRNSKQNESLHAGHCRFSLWSKGVRSRVSGWGRSISRTERESRGGRHWVH